MTETKPSPADLPNWPRLLSEQLAAAYVGLSINAFRARVGRLWPRAIRIGKRKLYDRAAIDRVVDDLAEPDEECPTDAVRRAAGGRNARR